MRRLPSEYVEVEYIQGVAGAYIDTGYKPNNNTRVDFTIETQSKSVFQVPFGTQLSGTTGKFYWLLSASLQYVQIGLGSGTFYGINKNGTQSYNTNGNVSPTNEKYVGYMDGQGNWSYKSETIDAHGTLTASSGQSFTLSNTSNLYLFHRNGGATTNIFTGRICALKITESEVVKRDFIPAKKKSNNEYGMYDLVGKQFYGNNGTGSFTGGEEVPLTVKNYNVKNKYSVVPSEYEEVEYIGNRKSTGAEASYINTGLVLGRNNNIEIAFNTVAPSSGPWVFGSRNVVNKGYAFNIQSALVVTAYGGNTTINGVALRDDNKHIVSVKNGIWSADGVQFSDQSSKDFNGLGDCLLFGMTTTSGSIENRAFSGNIYYFKAWNGTELIAYFIPVKKKSNSEYGMYDIVSNQFFGNSGTGSFTGGQSVNRVKQYILKEPVRYQPALADDTAKYPTELNGFKKMVLTGVENWSRHATYPLFLSTTPNDALISKTVQASICDSMEGIEPSIGAGSVRNMQIKIGYYSTYAVRNIYVRNDAYTTVESWKDYLSSNNITVLYPLSTSDGSVWKFVKDTKDNSFGYLNEATGEYVKAYGATGTITTIKTKTYIIKEVF